MLARSVTILGIIFILFIIIDTPEICSQTETEQADVPQFSASRGFYENSFNVIVSSELPGAIIKYSVDGSDPKNSVSAQIQNSPATIQIDPDILYGLRGKTPGVILRACVVAPGYTMSESVTQTYLFINKIGELSPDGIKPGTGWPNPTTSGQYIIYGMDPNVLNDPRYSNLIDSAMLSIPTISLVTDLKNLFDPDSGIYVNAMEDGAEWERRGSIELMNPDGSEGFQINAGIRIRGGWSRHDNNPKHAFRLFFRSEYGAAKLKYPLFGDEGVDEFDKIDLRTSQNYSWSYPGHLGEVNTMNRDVFSRDLQGKIGQPYTRSRYYHLYINGYYWGLFQSQERPEAHFAESYFGGSNKDYDVVKVSGWWNYPSYSVETTDGNLDAYQDIWNLCVTGFQGDINYFKLQGLNTDGTLNPSYKNLVDVDNLIDYMLIIFYTGNFDSPTSKFNGNQMPNNFYAIYKRNANEGFRFFIHDAEHTIRTTAGEGPGEGLTENRVSLGSEMDVTSLSQFHPQWLHYKLTSNAEYRIYFADHVYKHFFNLCSMTPQKASALFQSSAKKIEMAIIGESARWGDTYLNPPGTKELWQEAVDDIIQNYFPYRTNIVLDQLKTANLYPHIDPPTFENNNEEIHVNSLAVEPGYVVKLINPNNTTGTIKYTIDGKDPRLIGGNLSGSAFEGGDDIEITINTTTIIKARVLNGSVWSALHKIILFADNSTSDIKITEINYHPLDKDSISDNEYEFLELKNIGSVPVNLSEMRFVDGIGYTFPDGTMIELDEFIILSSNKEEFNNRYGFYPFGEYSGQLDNGGERITLISTSTDTIFSIKYNDKSPWPESPDGEGYSLVPKELNPTGDLNDPLNWRASYEINGSPGKDDLPTSVIDKKGIPDKIELSQNYPNPFNPETNIHYNINTAGRVRISIYDVLGREVSVLVNKVQYPGRYDIKFSGNKLATGIYFYRLQTENTIMTKKMLLLK